MTSNSKTKNKILWPIYLNGKSKRIIEQTNKTHPNTRISQFILFSKLPISRSVRAQVYVVVYAKSGRTEMRRTMLSQRMDVDYITMGINSIHQYLCRLHFICQFLSGTRIRRKMRRRCSTGSIYIYYIFGLGVTISVRSQIFIKRHGTHATLL